jgi:tRNA (mo5U34)-methyltransferase
MTSHLEEEILRQKWFYQYCLPSGKVTETRLPPYMLKIHDTRLSMMFSALQAAIGTDWGNITCLDIGAHEGFFSFHLAKKGCKKVLGIDAREEHVRKADLIRKVYGLQNLTFALSDVHTINPSAFEPFDVVIMLGLIYHLENPVGALRKARNLTKRVLLVESQVMLNISGKIDWGTYRSYKEIQGIFGIIDETHEIEFNYDAGVTGIALCPSTEGLLWLMKALGFARVQLVPPPQDAYEQFKTGKRVMVAGYSD